MAKDPCNAEKVATRRSIFRYNLFKAYTLVGLVLVTVLLATNPALLGRVEFLNDIFGNGERPNTEFGGFELPSFDFDGLELPDTSGLVEIERENANDGRLEVSVVFMDRDGQRIEDEALMSSVEVNIYQPDGTFFTADFVGQEIRLPTGEYLVEVLDLEIPPKSVTIEADTLHDLVFIALE